MVSVKLAVLFGCFLLNNKFFKKMRKSNFIPEIEPDFLKEKITRSLAWCAPRKYGKDLLQLIPFILASGYELDGVREELNSLIEVIRFFYSLEEREEVKNGEV
jgi:hypothetical protein